MALLINDIDFTDRWIRNQGGISGSIGDLSYLAQTKKYLLKNYDEFLSPFNGQGFFFSTGWRGLSVVETDNDKRVFSGTIQNIRQDNAKRFVELTVDEPMTTLYEFKVDVLDKTSITGFTVAEDVPKGNTVITVTGNKIIPKYAVVTFNGQIIPEYMVYGNSGDPTTAITLDRQVEFDLSAGDTLSIGIPAVQTGPEAIKKALLTAGINADRLDGSFDVLDIEDKGAARLLWLNIKAGDKITLRDHLTNLSKLCNLYIIGRRDGSIKLRRGLAYSGEGISNTLTGAELIGSTFSENDKSKLYIGYDCLYLGPDDQILDENYLQPNEITAVTAGQKFFQPIKLAQGLLQYKYLYNSSDAARFYGDDTLNYWQWPRVNILTGAKKSYHGKPDKLLKLDIGDEFLLNFRGYKKEPVIVMGYTYNESTLQYTNVKLQLNNNPSPGLKL